MKKVLLAVMAAAIVLSGCAAAEENKETKSNQVETKSTNGDKKSETPKEEEKKEEPTKTDSAKDGSVTVGDFKFFDLTGDDKMGTYMGAIEVENTGKKDYTAVVFSVSFYDEAGKRVGKADGAIMDFPAGETKTADIVAMEEIGKYASYKVQVNQKA